MYWFDSIEHNRWLSARLQDLLDYGRKSEVKTGFACLDRNGEVDLEQPIQLYLTARMVHVFSLGVLLGMPGCRRLVEHGIRCLNQYFRDPENGGWFDAIEHELDADGHAIPYAGRDDKRSYSHAFVLLGAASATAADRIGAHELMQEAIRDNDLHWWDSQAGMVRESYNRDYSQCEDYRGVNSNMHMAEAYMLVAQVTNEGKWLDRTMRILERVAQVSREYSWRIPEHFDPDWKPQIGYNRENPQETHRAYGSDIGHSFTFSRLILETRAMLKNAEKPVPEWMMSAATGMFERAREDAGDATVPPVLCSLWIGRANQLSAIANPGCSSRQSARRLLCCGWRKKKELRPKRWNITNIATGRGLISPMSISWCAGGGSCIDSPQKIGL